MASIFVTGATGVIGRRVLPLLTAAGHVVTAVGRSTEKRAALPLMSGARHSTPPRRMSSTNKASLSVSARSKLIEAA